LIILLKNSSSPRRFKFDAFFHAEAPWNPVIHFAARLDNPLANLQVSSNKNTPGSISPWGVRAHRVREAHSQAIL
jgi:hypothetical protein